MIGLVRDHIDLAICVECWAFSVIVHSNLRANPTIVPEVRSE